MRKLLALLLCLALLPALPALAETNARVSLFRVTMADENGQERVVGSAIPMLDSRLLFTSAIIDEPERVRVYAPDGTAYEVQYVATGDVGITALVLDEPTDEPVPVFSAEDAARSRLVGMTPNGLSYDAPAASVAGTVFQEQEASLVSAREPLQPGAVLVDQGGGLIGLTVAEWGESEARYVALTGSVLVSALLDTVMAEPGNAKAENPRKDGRTAWLLDAELFYWEGMLVVDWSECEIMGLVDRSTVTVFVACKANNHYVYYTTAASDQIMLLDVVPGYAYDLWVSHTYGELDDARPAQYALSVEIPETGSLTDYRFTSQSYLAWAPTEEEHDVSELLPALEPITADALEDGARRLYLQVINTYEVDEEWETGLVIVLRTPEGHIYHSLSGYIFMPEIQDEDIWNAEVTALFRQYLRYNGTSSFTPGEYTLSYLIGGEWAGSFAFTLE